MVSKQKPGKSALASENGTPRASSCHSACNDRVEAVGRVFWFAVATALVAWGVWTGARQVSMQSWPTSKAMILEANLMETEDRSSWFPRVEYSYSVGGVEYKSDKINPSPFNYNKTQSAGYHADFDKVFIGATVRCWYNPANPAEAYLSNHGLSVGPALVCVAGIAFLLFVVFAMPKVPRAMHSRPPVRSPSV